eukprot:TRINITY_DN3485_c0_g1_i2.p1 TRINITY_DN3485_c0_g1~~TRINITY_DN3485_c0_g1_i2.p1  ORF type:complete len:445 (+),score=117.21 TRINITY_DN3485_c0_g1_i2:139-1335(+)
MFDGHSGGICAEYVCDALPTYLAKNSNFPTNVSRALLESFHELDQTFLSEEASVEQVSKSFWEADRGTKKGYLEDGCTALVGLLWEDTLTIANAGDCRALMVKADGSHIQLSTDHTPAEPSEQERIIAAGGKIKKNRINGRLGVSRGFGAYPYKNRETFQERLVTVEPEIQEFTVTPDSRFLVFATDGIWKKVTNQEVVDIIKNAIPSDNGVEFLQNPTEKLRQVALEIVKAADAKKERDNISVFIVAFQHVGANLTPMPSQKGFFEKTYMDFMMKKEEVSMRVNSKTIELQESMQPKMEEIKASVKDSRVNTFIKAKSKEYGKIGQEKTDQLVSAVSNLVNGDEEEPAEEKTPNSDEADEVSVTAAALDEESSFDANILDYSSSDTEDSGTNTILGL